MFGTCLVWFQLFAYNLCFHTSMECITIKAAWIWWFEFVFCASILNTHDGIRFMIHEFLYTEDKKPCRNCSFLLRFVGNPAWAWKKTIHMCEWSIENRPNAIIFTIKQLWITCNRVCIHSISTYTCKTTKSCNGIMEANRNYMNKPKQTKKIGYFIRLDGFCFVSSNALQTKCWSSPNKGKKFASALVQSTRKTEERKEMPWFSPRRRQNNGNRSYHDFHGERPRELHFHRNWRMSVGKS